MPPVYVHEPLIPITMKTITRLLQAFVLSACTALPGLAQDPFWLSTTMSATACTFGQTVTLSQEIYWGGTGNPTSASSNYALFTPGCGLTISQGGYGPNTIIILTCITTCNGVLLTQTETVQFTADPDTIQVSFNFDCTNGATDCLGTPGGSAQPGTPCTTFLNEPGTWSPACTCVPNAQACEACFIVNPLMGDSLPVPFTARFINCTSIGVAPFAYTWSFPDGTTSVLAEPTFFFNSPGTYQVCLSIVDANGCTSTTCNPVVVNAFGGINTIFPNPPYPLMVHIDLVNCAPGTTATIVSGNGAQPSYSFTVPLDADCAYLDTLWFTAPSGSISMSLSCDPIGTASTLPFDFNLGIGGVGFLFTSCPNAVFDCLQTPNGPNMPGTACTTPGGGTGIWSPSCICEPSGNADCEGVPGGTALPGTPCLVPGTVLEGIWGSDCECVPNGNTDCQAGFWVLQAYTIDSLNPNGGAIPIPNELWIWNLSSSSNTAATLSMTTTLGSTSATVTGCNGALMGAQVVGPNIPAGTSVIAVSCPSVVLSNPAATTGTALHNFSSTTGSFQFVWSWGDGTPNSTDPYPTHFYANGGPYELCLTIWDNAGCTDTHCDSVAIDDDGFYTGMVLEEGYARSGFTINVLNQLPTGISDQALTEERLWPNPVNESLSLSFRSTVNGNVPLSIIDLNGRVLHSDNLTFTRGDNRIDIGAAHLVPGMYVLRIGNDSYAMNIRFVKQ